MNVERRSDWNYPDDYSYRKDMFIQDGVDEEDYSMEEHQKEKWEEEYEEYCESEDKDSEDSEDDNEE